MTRSLLCSSPAELLLALPNGSIVLLPDGTVGEQTWGTHAVSHVIHRDRVHGSGPWVYARYQVEPATPGQASDYSQRCVDLLVKQTGPVAL